MDYKRFNSLVPQSLLDAVTEALKGNQAVLDVDGDGKLERSDFKKLRKNKRHEASETKSQEKKEHTGPCSADCGCMKEGAKEDEPPFEGPYRKPGTRKDEYGNKVKNVAKHLARKAMKNMSAEGYMPTADMPSDADKKTAQKVRGLLSKEKKLAKEEAELSEENVLIHAPGNKHHGKQARVFHKHDDGRVNVQLKHSSKKGDVSNFTLQPHQFTPTAVKEEAEQISELSNKVLKSYIKGASNQAFSKGYSGGAMTVRGDMNRDSEEEKAGEKNVHKAIKRVSGIRKAVNKLKTEAATPGVAAGSLPDGEHMCATNIMHKEWKEGQPIPTMHAEPDANGLIEWYDVMFEHGIERVNTADIEILEAMSHGHSKKKMKKEEVEQVDEDKNLHWMDNEDKGSEAKKRTPVEHKARYKKLVKDAEQFEKHSAIHSYAKNRAQAYKNYHNVNEEVELDEARPRGRPSAASKAEEDEPVALAMQLRKARSINKPVTFANKETKQVTGAQISSFNDHMAALRTTQEKAAFQKKCFVSYDSFAKACAVKAGNKPKDTGEIIKYGQ